MASGPAKASRTLVRLLVVALVVGATSRAAAAGADPRPAPTTIAPVVDTPAPWFWDDQTHLRSGAEADRFELDDPARAPSLSTWYRLSYTVGSDRIRVYDHSPATDHVPNAAIGASEEVSWHVATTLLGRTSGMARPGELPEWARPRTGTGDGGSAGLIFALADIDILTPGPLAGALRVAGTGAIGSDGAVTSVRMVDAKLAAAVQADADVVFAPDFPTAGGVVTNVASHVGAPSPDRTVGDWLDLAGYEAAGRAAGSHSGRRALVEVDDVREALAWLCGRTGGPACAISRGAATTPLRIARPYQRVESSARPSAHPDFPGI